MKRIIGASCVFVCNEDFLILENGGVVFESDTNNQENKILEIGDFKELTKKYPHFPNHFHLDCVLLPALSNAHIHFEFSNNKTHLIFGKFGLWLESVITQREELFESLEKSIQKEIANQLKSGIASVGAISSYGYDIQALYASPLRVTLFNEAIGSNPLMLDSLFGLLKERLEETQNLKNHRFHPALSIHSPYSTHYVLAKKVALLAKEKNLKMSCHFLESLEEKEWLFQKKGWFQGFFKQYFQQKNPTPSMNCDEFLELFDGLNALFVHCLFANEAILDKIAKLNGFIACSPRSNRLLNNAYLNLEHLKHLNLLPIFSTDGLSSNYSLNLIDEIRSAFFGYAHLEAQSLAKDLILGITRSPAKALGISNGELCSGKFADLAIFPCPNISKSKQKPIHFVLYAHNEVKELYINGIGVKDGKTF